MKREYAVPIRITKVDLTIIGSLKQNLKNKSQTVGLENTKTYLKNIDTQMKEKAAEREMY